MSGEGKNSPAPVARVLIADAPGSKGDPGPIMEIMTGGRPVALLADEQFRRTCWIPLSTGGTFYPFDPRPEDINLADIARGLSREPRWNGQGRYNLVGAQHSVILSHLVSERHQLAALFHDAPEGLGFHDLGRRFRQAFPDHAVEEDAVLAAIAARFGFDLPLAPEILDMDTRLAVDEWLFLFATPAPLEMGPGTGRPLDLIGLDRAWSPEEAFGRFVDRFYEILRGLA